MSHHKHFKLYKPFGMLSQFSSNNEKQIRRKRFLSELIEDYYRLMPVGRLDEKSEGLLLITTNGKLSDDINRAGIEKEYLAQVDGIISPEAISKLAKGVEIGFEGKRYQTKPCKVQSISILPSGIPEADGRIRAGRHRPNSWISMTITEGKFRQVRKMTAAVGFPTLRLIRVRIGDITLDKMQPGDLRNIEIDENLNSLQ